MQNSSGRTRTIWDVSIIASVVYLRQQDISSFRGSIEELNHFNEAGRAKIALLRKSIERLDDHVTDLNNPTLSSEVDSHRQQFSR